MAYRALLRPTALITETISTSVVHPAYFPYPLPLVLHAVRISHAYSSKVKASGHKLPPFQHLAGFLVMAWGGGLWTNALLCLPPVQLYSVTPWIIYCSVHLAMTTLFGSILPAVSSNRISWPSGRVMDTIYPPLDAICRSTPIIAAISAAKNHSNPQLRESLLAQLVLGAVASMGGGAAAGFFGVWDKEWSLKTPAFLKGGLLPTMDLWAGAVAAAIYGIATLSHPAYEPINEFLVGKPKAFMTPLGAKATVVLYLTSMYVIRVALTHYLPANAPASSRGKKLGAATPTSSGQRVAVKPVSKEKKAQ